MTTSVALQSCILFPPAIRKNENLTLKTSFNKCPSTQGAAYLKVILYNKGNKNYWVDPKYIYYNTFTVSDRQPHTVSISESTNRSEKEVYFLPANDSVSFDIIDVKFQDYIFDKDSTYYIKSSLIPVFQRKKINNYFPINFYVRAGKEFFTICEPNNLQK